MSAPADPTLPRLVTTRDDERAHRAVLQAEQDRVRALTARVKRLERTIRIFLTSATLTPAQRAELLELLAGTRTGQQPSVTLAEMRHLETFRLLSASRRRIVSQLIGELAPQEGPRKMESDRRSARELRPRTRP